jgi:hypothetical protein
MLRYRPGAGIVVEPLQSVSGFMTCSPEAAISVRFACGLGYLHQGTRGKHLFILFYSWEGEIWERFSHSEQHRMGCISVLQMNQRL